VIAAGERWSLDDSLRPALEDHLGAGAILSALAELGHSGGFSPEAWAAADLFDVSRSNLGQRLHSCVGGRELAAQGFASDVKIAAELNASSTVPVLNDGAFQQAGS
jgi:2-phosphosulfolactate phosphatase